MKRYRIPIAVGLLLVPVLVRLIWFHQGIFWRSSPLATPDYGALTVPAPPLSAAESASDAASSRAIVLLDQAHSNMFSPSELVSLTGLIESRGARVEYVTGGSSDYGYDSYVSFGSLSLTDQLKYASAYVSICPIVSYSLDEIQALQEFVRRGGRLMILTDPTRSVVSYDYYGYGPATITADVVAANSLLAAYDISFLDDYLYNMTKYEGNYRNVFFTGFSANALTKNLDTVVFYAAHSLLTGTGTVLIQSSEKTKSSRTDADGEYAVAALDASGNVLAIGDMTFLQYPYSQVADNALLVRHLADFLLGAQRIHDLKDFPYVFLRDVVIIPAKDVQLSSSLLGPLQSLQQDLAGVGIVATIGEKAETGKDLIVLGTFSSPGIEKYLDPLGIKLPSSAAFPMPSGGSQIVIPGFGSISSFGIGLIVFHRTDSQSTLVLIAESSDSVTSLMNVLGPQGFSECILQGNVAVCAVGGGYGGYNDAWWLYGDGGEESTEPYYEETTSTTTPTAAG